MSNLDPIEKKTAELETRSVATIEAVRDLDAEQTVQVSDQLLADASGSDTKKRNIKPPTAKTPEQIRVEEKGS